jgi:hypothetical protein
MCPPFSNDTYCNEIYQYPCSEIFLVYKFLNTPTDIKYVNIPELLKNVKTIEILQSFRDYRV